MFIINHLTNLIDDYVIFLLKYISITYKNLKIVYNVSFNLRNV